MDYPGFASEMGTLLAQGYDELLVNKFTHRVRHGRAEGNPDGDQRDGGRPGEGHHRRQHRRPGPVRGVEVAAAEVPAERVLADVRGVNNAIRQIGAANVFHGYTVNLPEGWADQLFNRPVYESAYMPDTTTWTTTAEGQAIVGDFSNFVIARNAGCRSSWSRSCSKQVTAGSGPAVPTGQRGWFAYARIGSDSSNTAGFRLLVANS